MSSNKHIINFCILGILTLFYCTIHFGSPHFVNDLYEEDKFHILNQLALTKDHQTLDYYHGAIEDSLFGPLKSIISAIILLAACCLYFRDTSFIKLALVILTYLLATRFSVLFNPPYGETIIGHFSDATWLYNHDFNYLEYFKQKSFSLYGSGVLHYPTSIYPSIMAFFMAVAPNVPSFLFLSHVLVFVLSALTIVLMYRSFKHFFPSIIALLSAFLLLTLPIYQSMTEVLNMEIPCLFGVILCIYFLLKKDIPKASLAAILAVLIKAPGGIASIAVFIAALILILTGEKKEERLKIAAWGILPLIVSFAKAVIRGLIIGQQPRHNRIDLFIGAENIFKLPVTWLCIFLIATLIVRGCINALISKSSSDSSPQSFMSFLQKNYHHIIMKTMIFMWFALYINFSVMQPRYPLLLAPFMIYLIIYCAYTFTKNDTFIMGFLVTLILMASLGSHGLFSFKPEGSSAYSYNTLERSLEYRNDLKVNKVLAKTLEEKFSNFAIGAPFVQAQMLVMPELGYVTKPLDVFIYGSLSTHERLKEFKGLAQLNIKRTIWVGSEDDHITDQVDFPIGKNDTVIKEIIAGNKKISLFVGGFAIEKMRQRIFYIRQQHKRKIIQQKIQQLQNNR